jgi:acetyl-CoA carboxylase biotin carboxyl carrier protein
MTQGDTRQFYAIVCSPALSQGNARRPVHCRWRKGANVSSQNLTYQDLLQIVEWIKSSAQFGEFHLKVDNIELHLRRHSAPAPSASAPAALEVRPPLDPTSPSPTRQPQPQSQTEDTPVQREALNGRMTTPADAARGVSPVYPEHTVLITSPMVGTFYRAPEPGAPPFVEVGQWVEPDTTVCIIEVMKLMHSMPARHRGVVTHILVEDAAPVEYGQALLVLDPHVDAASPEQAAGASAPR